MHHSAHDGGGGGEFVVAWSASELVAAWSASHSSHSPHLPSPHVLELHQPAHAGGGGGGALDTKLIESVVFAVLACGMLTVPPHRSHPRHFLCLQVNSLHHSTQCAFVATLATSAAATASAHCEQCWHSRLSHVWRLHQPGHWLGGGEGEMEAHRSQCAHSRLSHVCRLHQSGHCTSTGAGGGGNTTAQPSHTLHSRLSHVFRLHQSTHSPPSRREPTRVMRSTVETSESCGMRP